MTGYKFTNYVGKSVNTVPGYCCTGENKLFYVNMVGLTVPVYRFEIENLQPWVDDDIVGMVWEPSMAQICQKYRIPNEQIPDALKKLSLEAQERGGFAGDQREKFTCWARMFQPGWHWTPEIEIGCPGESIVNAKTRMDLVDGQDLLDLIEQADQEGLASKAALIEEAKTNGVPYNIDWNDLVAESVASQITDDPDVPDQSVQKEIKKHRANLQRYTYILQ